MGSFFSTPSASQLRAAAQRQGASINWQHVLCPLLGNTPAATLLEKESGSEDTVFHNILRRSTNEQVMRALLARFDDHPEELKLVLCSRNRHGQSPLHLVCTTSIQKRLWQCLVCCLLPLIPLAPFHHCHARRRCHHQ
eukprot:m.269559 g.269559  ORF g.269559 m.269559 type:complete len:138 (-) comp19304_c2_seq1:36-449(-)